MMMVMMMIMIMIIIIIIIIIIIMGLTEYHYIAAQTIIEQPMSFAVGTRLPRKFSKRIL
jgi:hypothetical protein